MNPREPVFSGKTGRLYKPSKFYYFKNTSSPFDHSPWICTCLDGPSPT